MKRRYCPECGTGSPEERRRKRIYADAASAWSAASALVKRSGGYARAYECPHGFGWHLTSLTPDEYRLAVMQDHALEAGVHG